MICEVAVFGFTLKPNTFTYQVPNGTVLFPGMIVEVPFGKGSRIGVVVEVSDRKSDLTLKEIGAIKNDCANISSQHLALAKKISKRYFISQAEALHLILPRLPRVSTQMYQSTKEHINQELLLFPTLRQAEEAKLAYPGSVFSHSLLPKHFDKLWQDINGTQVTRVLGTRSALFAPFQKLSKITIFQPESDLYKDERHPYYRTLQVALDLAEIWHIKVQPISYSPRVQDHFQIPHLIKKLEQRVDYELVDLKKQETINDLMLNLLEKNPSKSTLIFLNRKSEKGPLVCRTCKVRSYVLDPSTCPNCGGADVKFQVFNLGTIHKKITARVKTEAVFATQQIFFQPAEKFDLIVVLSADTYLSKASYYSTEKTFQMITQLQRLLNPNGKILIQTAHPKEPAIVLALLGDYLSFYQTELANRLETGYPPYSRLAKATFANKAPIPELSLNQELEIFGPFLGQKYQYYVVRGQDLSSLSDLPRPWRIDLDPLSL